MPSNPNTSFIPKQGPVRRPRQTASRSVHLFSVISYIALISTMVASVGSFFYAKHIDKQLENKVQELSQAIGGFNEEDMEDVREFNIRLSQARERLDNGASVRAVFESIEDATAASVSLASLKMERFDDNNLVVKAEVQTDNFDSSLFQRGVFERSSVVESVEVKELKIVERSESEDGPIESGVTFMAEITVPVSKVPNTPTQNTVTQTEEVLETPVSTTTETSLESEPEEIQEQDELTDTNEITP